MNWSGSWATLHTRFRRWAENGTFERMLREAQAQADAAGEADWLVSVDTTKIHHACDALGRPLGSTVTGGNTNDCTQFTDVMAAIWVPCIGPGRPRVRPLPRLG